MSEGVLSFAERARAKEAGVRALGVAMTKARIQRDIDLAILWANETFTPEFGIEGKPKEQKLIVLKPRSLGASQMGADFINRIEIP